MSKSSSTMQKEVEKEEDTQGQQMDLINVAPENSKEIIQHARIYNAALKRRLQALKEETAEKQKLLTLIKEAHLQRLENGMIKFRCDGFTITVTPRDELVKIQEKEDEAS